jgi:hypothetical protein
VYTRTLLQVKDAPLSRKTAFLEQKGLTAAEIALALAAAGGAVVGGGGAVGGGGVAVGGAPMGGVTAGMMSPGGGLPPGAGGYPMGYAPVQPMPAPLGWKDYFIGTVVGATAAYGLAVAAKEYILPRLGWFGGDAAKQLEDLNSSITQFQAAQGERCVCFCCGGLPRPCYD